MADRVNVGRLGPFPRVSRPVFSVSATIIVLFIVFGAVFTETAGTVFTGAQDAITVGFGWFFILTVNLILILCVYLAFGRYGDVRLGGQSEKAQYGIVPWSGMLFSAGIGIGLLYWGTAEPLYHFFAPPLAEPESQEAASQAMAFAFLHWGFHGWAVYILVGLALGYFHFRKGLPLSVRSALYPLIGDRIYGPIGHAVDCFAVFGTMFGIVTSLGLGVMQISAGLGTVFGTPDTLWMQIALIAFITALATISVVLGLDKGIKRISTFNIGLSIAMLAFVIAVGPTLFIIDSYIENIGTYLHSVLSLSFWNEAYSDENWQGSWTIFYWAWWVSWSPFVGIFIARISRGRTIREFVVGVFLIPSAILFLWFTAFGGTAIHMELAGDPGLIEATREDYGNAVFALVGHFPFSSLLSVLIIVMIIVWFVTSSDSGSFVIDMLTAGGDPNPPRIQRVFWAITEGCVAAVLLVAGGLEALQAAAVVAGFPFAFVLLVIAYALLRALGRDRLILYRQEQLYRTEEEVDANTPDAITHWEEEDMEPATTTEGRPLPAE
ncbi:BCCT family transporter [Lutibaculum baratangense]|uniref:High-affinity choline uptake protein BetT n=1 Tax=Lutibaculum baratangense AMV1 TaxID=631454 RepID=V4RIX7_9HYPH|nr:BCCT family transporter [Lutibaculum baratangense]ESR25279.1 High-affinity choline uptake protein BetT [Lutibaculum baratangense AMV1]